MNKALNTIKNFIKASNAKNISAHAAAGAFYMFLAFVPFVALIASLIPYTGLEKEAVLNTVSPYIPDALRQLSESVLNDVYRASSAFVPLSALTALWLSSKSSYSVICGIEAVYSTPVRSSFIKRKLLAIIYMGALAISMLIIAALLVLGESISDISSVPPIISLLFELRLVFVLLFMTLVLAGMYRFAPGAKKKSQKLLPGAFLAACVWLLFTWLFSLYIRYKGSYGMYGNLAGIVISLMWMYWCIYIILLGAQLNCHLRK